MSEQEGLDMIFSSTGFRLKCLQKLVRTVNELSEKDLELHCPILQPLVAGGEYRLSMWLVKIEMC